MPRYSEDRKQAILSKLLPPLSLTVAEVSRTEGIGLQTLYNWRNKARQQGQPMPGNKTTPDDWSNETKLATIIETGSLSDAELSECCRRKGIYVEKIKAWRANALQGFSSSKLQSLKDKRQQQTDKKHIKQLQRELNRKEKALAETAALLVLRKKLDAFWETGNEDDWSCCQNANNTYRGYKTRISQVLLPLPVWRWASAYVPIGAGIVTVR